MPIGRLVLAAVFAVVISNCTSSRAQTAESPPPPAAAVVVEGMGLVFVPANTTQSCRGSVCTLTLREQPQVDLVYPSNLKHAGAYCSGEIGDRFAAFSPPSDDFVERGDHELTFRFTSDVCSDREIRIRFSGDLRNSDVSSYTMAVLSGWRVCILRGQLAYECGTPEPRLIFQRRAEVEAALRQGGSR